MTGFGHVGYAKHITLPSGSIVSSQNAEPEGPGEVIAWEYAPVLKSGKRWGSRGEAAALIAKDRWSEYEPGEDEEYDPVVGVDKRMVTVTYGDWQRA